MNQKSKDHLPEGAFYLKMSYKAAAEMPARPGTPHLKAQLKALLLSSLINSVPWSALHLGPQFLAGCWLEAALSNLAKGLINTTPPLLRAQTEKAVERINWGYEVIIFIIEQR